TSTRGVRARIRRVAGCAPPTGSAAHAGETANLKLTFHLDHSAGADHNSEAYCATDQSERPRRVFRRMADYAPLIHPTDLSSCGLTRASILFAKSSGRSASLSRSVIREI